MFCDILFNFLCEFCGIAFFFVCKSPEYSHFISFFTFVLIVSQRFALSGTTFIVAFHNNLKRKKRLALLCIILSLLEIENIRPLYHFPLLFRLETNKLPLRMFRYAPVICISKTLESVSERNTL